MITNIITFSRDRALQLDAVLRSFFLHCRDGQQAQVVVLYRATTAQHARQYRALDEAYPQVRFYQQRHFRRDVLRLIAPYPPGSPAAWGYRLLNALVAGVIACEQIPLRLVQALAYRLRTRLLARLFPAPPAGSCLLFLVDDNLFVQDFSITTMLNALQANPDALGFSLRLGENITYCYAVNQPQALPEFTSLGDGILKFDWTTSELDFAYPLEVSSSVYRLKDILPVIVRQPFANPNELEYQLAVSAGQFSHRMPFLLCPEKSLTFCNPLNLVQNFVPNRASKNIEYTSDRLADVFDQGYRVDITAYDGFIPNSCHQEVPLEFSPSNIVMNKGLS